MNSEDQTFHITTERNTGNLIESIQQVGLMIPPILKEKFSEYIIVSGFRRVAACRSLGWTRIRAKIVDPACGMDECVKLAITDNALQRPLNLVETSRSLHLLSGQIKDRAGLTEAASSFGLPDNLAVIQKLLKICLLPTPIQNNILAGSLSLSTALAISRFEPETALALAKIFETLRISLNKQKEILSLVQEIALREGIPLRQLLEEERINSILRDEELDRNSKARKLRSYLRERRYPVISKAEARFAEYAGQLKLNDALKLTPPPNFEGTTYTFTLRFETRSELENLHAKLGEIIRHTSLQKILDRR
ncbi:MAG: ParB N-terminal domain-containing protein [Desulfobacterales bacterium]|nr:MAG: ParB N-terminal domain-containing protein [Desulfobacterales bacterium]